MKHKLIAACFAVFSAFYSCDNACGCVKAEVTMSDKLCCNEKENGNFKVGLYAGTDWSPLRSERAKTPLKLQVTYLGDDYHTMVDQWEKKTEYTLGPKKKPCRASFSCMRDMTYTKAGIRMKSVFTWEILLDELLKAHGWKDEDGNYSKFFTDTIDSGYMPTIEFRFNPEETLTLTTRARVAAVAPKNVTDLICLQKKHTFLVTCHSFGIELDEYYDLDSFDITPEIQQAADELKNLVKEWGVDMEKLEKKFEQEKRLRDRPLWTCE